MQSGKKIQGVPGQKRGNQILRGSVTLDETICKVTLSGIFGRLPDQLFIKLVIPGKMKNPIS